MSTRSEIRIISEGQEAIELYHHCDGYFEGVGKELQDVLKKHLKERHDGDNAFLAEDVVNELLRDSSYEVTFVRHWDIEYFNLLDFDKNEFRGWATVNDPFPDELFDGDEWRTHVPEKRRGSKEWNLLKPVPKEDYGDF